MSLVNYEAITNAALPDDVILQTSRLAAKFGSTPVNQSLVGHQSWCTSSAWNCDGSMLASSSTDGSIFLWNPLDFKRIGKEGYSKHNTAVNLLKWSPVTSHLLGSTSPDQGILLWDQRDGGAGPNMEFCKPPKRDDGPLEVFAFDFSSDGNEMMTLAPDGRSSSSIQFWDLRNPNTPLSSAIIRSRPSKDKCAVWLPSGLVSTTAPGGQLALFHKNQVENTDNSQLNPLIISAHTSTILSMDAKQNIFATGGTDSMVSIWDSFDICCLRSFCCGDSTVRAVALSRDASVIACVQDVGISIYSIYGTRLGMIRETNIWNIAWHPTKNIVAYGGEGNQTGSAGKYLGTMFIANYEEAK